MTAPDSAQTPQWYYADVHFQDGARIEKVFLFSDHERELSAARAQLAAAEKERDELTLKYGICADSYKCVSALWTEAKERAESAEARLRECEADAERYRYLRDAEEFAVMGPKQVWLDDPSDLNATLDKAIADARERQA